MTIMKLLMTLVLFTTIVFRETYAHGRMVYPLSRSSLWRKTFPSEVNKNDFDLNCGGPIVQYEQNHGKCGLCGDDYSLPQPRPNENGGTYGKGMISRAYKKNSIINITIELSGNHQGQFNFDMCVLKEEKMESDECFSQYQMTLAGGKHYTLNVTKSSEHLVRDIVVRVKLPQRLLCKQCVLRWQFRSVDSFETNRSKPITYNETWRNCADIAILRPNAARTLLRGKFN